MNEVTLFDWVSSEFEFEIGSLISNVDNRPVTASQVCAFSFPEAPTNVKQLQYAASFFLSYASLFSLPLFLTLFLVPCTVPEKSSPLLFLFCSPTLLF